MTAEIWRLTGAACVCGLLPLGENVARGLYGQGVLLAELTAAGLVVVSYGLLGGFLFTAALGSKLFRPRVALLVGSGQRAEQMKRRLLRHGSRMQIFGCVDDEYCGADRDADNYLGPIAGLAELLKTYPIEIVLIGLPVKSKYDAIQSVIDVCETTGVESHYMADVFETSRARVEKHREAPRGVCGFEHAEHDPKRHLKTSFRFAGGAFAGGAADAGDDACGACDPDDERGACAVCAAALWSEPAAVSDVQVSLDGGGCRGAAGCA